MEDIVCPLCYSKNTNLFSKSRIRNLKRDYFRCYSCRLIFVPKQFHLNEASQKKRYLEHNNDPEDQRYRLFLFKLQMELVPYLATGSKGIDYGSGPGPALSNMLKEYGFKMNTYDLFFQPNRSVLSERYHFVTCTETVEHFAHPAQEFLKFDSLLEPGGWIGIMTSFVKSESRFDDWYYQRDPTHIAFYSQYTMKFIGKIFNWVAIFPRQNVVLFRKAGKEQN